jgi:hypothetical protein
MNQSQLVIVLGVAAAVYFLVLRKPVTAYPPYQPATAPPTIPPGGGPPITYPPAGYVPPASSAPPGGDWNWLTAAGHGVGAIIGANNQGCSGEDCY